MLNLKLLIDIKIQCFISILVIDPNVACDDKIVLFDGWIIYLIINKTLTFVNENKKKE